VENALYNDSRVQEAAAVGVPDERLGELVAAVVSIKPAYQGYVTEAALLATARQKYAEMFLKIDLYGNSFMLCSLPRFAVPVMIVLLNEPFSKWLRYL